MPRAVKFLPKKATPRVLQYLEKYLEDKKVRRDACAALFQCGIRQADRITNRKTPYTGKMRRFWVNRLAAELRIPVVRLLGKDSVPYPNALLGWADMPAGVNAMEAAMKIGEAILHQAFAGFNLSGRVTISHYSGMPEQVVAALTLDPALASVSAEHGYSRIVVEAEAPEDGNNYMHAYHYKPSGENAGDGQLTATWLEFQFEKIYGLSANYAANLVRESS